jgi:hypothetical protein
MTARCLHYTIIKPVEVTCILLGFHNDFCWLQCPDICNIWMLTHPVLDQYHLTRYAIAWTTFQWPQLLESRLTSTTYLYCAKCWWCLAYTHLDGASSECYIHSSGQQYLQKIYSLIWANVDMHVPTLDAKTDNNRPYNWPYHFALPTDLSRCSRGFRRGVSRGRE